MLLIEPRPLPTPADAERLLADLWQLSAGRPLGLFLVGLPGVVRLGVRSNHRGVEDAAAATVAEQCGGSVESDGLLEEMLAGSRDFAAINLLPADRHLVVENPTFGWQRSDPLRATYLALRNTPEQTVAGIALGLRALPDLSFVVSLGAWSAGADAVPGLARLTASLGGVGVRLRRPLGQRRACRRMLEGALRRPMSVRRVEVISRFWHPPYGFADLAPAPAGLLAGPGA